MTQQHPIETAWRQMRRHYAALFALVALRAPNVWSVLRARGAAPERLRHARQAVPAPSRATYDVLHALLGINRAEVYAQLEAAGGHKLLREVQGSIDPLKAERTFLPDLITFFSAWRTEKRLYRFTPALVDALRHMDWPGQYPTDKLLPPASAVVLEFPPAAPGEPVRTLLVHLNLSLWDTPSATLSLWVMELLPRSAAESHALVRPLATLDLVKPTLEEAFEHSRMMAAHEVSSLVRAISERDGCEGTVERQELERIVPHGSRNADLTLVINALLFLANQNDVVSEAAGESARAAASPLPGARKRHQMHARASAKQQRAKDLTAPDVLRVGVRYEQDLTRYLRFFEPPPGTGVPDCSGSNAASGLGTRSVRPHLRAPHWHLYWTGVGRTNPRLTFIAPIYVGGGPPSTEDAPAPMVRKVR